VSVPARSDAQRRQALAAALEARTERVRVRSAIRAGDLTAAEVIRGAGERSQWAALPVAWLISCVPGFGPVRTARLLAAAAVPKNRRVQGLGVRQRALLVDALEAAS